MPQPDSDFIAIIPTLNEIQHIVDVVQRASKYVPIVVIDDGSTDGSGTAARMAGATVIVHESNQGKGAALNTGFDYALEKNVAAAITLDADGQHDPDEIPRFIEAFRSGSWDFIIGQRTFAQMPFVRQFGNRTGTWLLSRAMGQAIPDNQCGYRLLSRDVLRVARPRAGRFESEVEIILRAKLAGFRITWIPISTIYGDETSYFDPVNDSLLFLKTVWRIWRARRRGRFE